MLPVPFVTGNLRYDGIFIAVVRGVDIVRGGDGQVAEGEGSGEGKGSRIVFLFGGDDLAGYFSGFHVLLSESQRAAIPWRRTCRFSLRGLR